MRSRLLRRVHIAQRKRVLDLGAGWGAVTGELTQRAASGALTVALDREFAPLHLGQWPLAAQRVQADAAHLPFAPASYDLIFCQCALLWMPPAALDEIARLLAPAGVLLALEPDYGGLLEYPPESAARELWLSALTRAGADPFIGRKLPGLLAARGFDLRVDLIPELTPPSPARFAFLHDLPLTPAEQAQVQQLAAAAQTAAAPWSQLAHLPFCLITAMKPAPC